MVGFVVFGQQAQNLLAPQLPEEGFEHDLPAAQHDVPLDDLGSDYSEPVPFAGLFDGGEPGEDVLTRQVALDHLGVLFLELGDDSSLVDSLELVDEVNVFGIPHILLHVIHLVYLSSLTLLLFLSCKLEFCNCFFRQLLVLAFIRNRRQIEIQLVL